MSGYGKELRVALQLAEEAGRVLLGYAARGDTKPSTKADGTPVRNADLESQKLIGEGLQKAFRLDGIVAEEDTTRNPHPEAPRQWYVDPLDGTAGYPHEPYAVMIGLAKGRKPVLGVVLVLDPKVRGKPIMYYACDGKAYVMSGKRGWRWSGPSELPIMRPHKNNVTHENNVIIQAGKFDEDDIARLVREEFGDSIRIRYGSALGFNICDVAGGAASAAIDFRGADQTAVGGPWDTCAPEAIVRVAGGKMTDLRQKKFCYDGKVWKPYGAVTAASEEAHKKAMRVASESMRTLRGEHQHP